MAIFCGQSKSYKFITNALRFKKEVDVTIFLCYSSKCDMRAITHIALLRAEEGLC